MYLVLREHTSILYKKNKRQIHFNLNETIFMYYKIGSSIVINNNQYLYLKHLKQKINDTKK